MKSTLFSPGKKSHSSLLVKDVVDNLLFCLCHFATFSEIFPPSLLSRTSFCGVHWKPGDDRNANLIMCDAEQPIITSSATTILHSILAPCASLLLGWKMDRCFDLQIALHLLHHYALGTDDELSSQALKLGSCRTRSCTLLLLSF